MKRQREKKNGGKRNIFLRKESLTQRKRGLWNPSQVRVHYRSLRPEKIGALAYAYGNQIYLAPGQEDKLPHELIHSEYQAYGLVRPTEYRKGVPFNTSPTLEKAAEQGVRPHPTGNAPRAVVQMVIDPARVRNWRVQQRKSAGTPDSPQFRTASAISGASRGGKVYLAHLTGKNSPCNLWNMSYWTNYKGADGARHNLLKEPKRPYTLTRMHVINGTFHGPSSPENMVLGLKQDNHHHLVQAESMVRVFLQWNRGLGKGEQALGVQYGVLPGQFAFPAYMNSRQNWVKEEERTKWKQWVASACPQILYCTAQFVAKGGDGIIYESEKQRVSIPMNQA